jgi:type IV secretory pathway TrbF-like protein
MLNPDGRLWIDRLSNGLVDTGERLSAADGERIVRLVAHHVGAEVHAGSPRVSAELPETGERFEGLLPPVVAAPAFAIRKPAVAVFTLDDYAAAGIVSTAQAAILRLAVAERRNILVAGGTSTGKTTLTNALLAEVAKTADRVVLIEDTRELQCLASNLVALRTRDGVVSLSELVRSSLRLRPDRIPIGEVRGAEALVQAKNWRLMAFGSLALSGCLAGGMVWQSARGTITPWVVEIDKLGQAQAIAPASADYQPADPQIAYHLARFIEDVRGLPADPIILRQQWLRAYDFTTDRGAIALNEYARTNDPFANSGKIQISVEVSSVIRASPDSFRVAWNQHRYENGSLSSTERWTAILSIVLQTRMTQTVCGRIRSGSTSIPSTGRRSWGHEAAVFPRSRISGSP